MTRRALALLVALLALAGCSRAAGGTSTRSKGAAGMFSIADGEPDHLTPGRAGSAGVEIRALFAPLTTVEANGTLQNLQAASITSADDRVWTIRIKPGWTFHNGEPVTARSYADAWNATAYGPHHRADNSEFADLVGYPAMNTEKPKARTLSGVTVVNDTTLRVRLIRPDRHFPYRLSEPGFLPLPKVAFTRPAAYDDEPIGDGPFRMDGPWRHHMLIALSRYEDYRGPAPKADRIQIKLYRDMDTAYADAQSGDIDVVQVPPDRYAQVATDFPDHYIARDAPTVDVLDFPAQDRRFADIRVRKAISLAIDRTAIAGSTLGGLLSPAAATGRFDPARARTLLAAAGGWHGPLQLWYPSGTGYDQTIEAIAAQLRHNLGIASVSVHGVPGFGALATALAQGRVSGPYFAQRTSVTAGDDAADEPPAGARRFPVVPLFDAEDVYVYSQRVSHVTVGPNGLEPAQVVAGG